MKLDEWKVPFGEIRSLVCESMRFDGEFCLEIELVEHHTVDRPHKARNGSPFEKLLERTKPIERTSDSSVWTVVFNNAIAFRSSSESFCFDFDKLDRPVEGGRAFFLNPSPWIREIEDSGLLSSVYPNSNHYVILTDHCIIEAISPDAPRIDS